MAYLCAYYMVSGIPCFLSGQANGRKGLAERWRRSGQAATQPKELAALGNSTGACLRFFLGLLLLAMKKAMLAPPWPAQGWAAVPFTNSESIDKFWVVGLWRELLNGAHFVCQVLPSFDPACLRNPVTMTLPIAQLEKHRADCCRSGWV